MQRKYRDRLEPTPGQCDALARAFSCARVAYVRALAEVKAARARGEKATRKVRKPRMKSRHHDQAVRFTANSRFRVVPNGRLRLPKVGDLKVRWSRELPAEPSSVTVTLDRAGR